MMKTFKSILIKLIRGYKYLISPFLGNSCRYMPTCSDYCIDAIKTQNFIKALYLSLKRILSCHPWNDGGFDPVEKQIKVKK